MTLLQVLPASTIVLILGYVYQCCRYINIGYDTVFNKSIFDSQTLNKIPITDMSLQLVKQTSINSFGDF